MWTEGMSQRDIAVALRCPLDFVEYAVAEYGATEAA